MGGGFLVKVSDGLCAVVVDVDAVGEQQPHADFCHQVAFLGGTAHQQNGVICFETRNVAFEDQTGKQVFEDAVHVVFFFIVDF